MFAPRKKASCSQGSWKLCAELQIIAFSFFRTGTVAGRIELNWISHDADYAAFDAASVTIRRFAAI
jgi:hypothetical protein